MCGHFALHSSVRHLATFAGLPSRSLGNFSARYNIAPGRPILNFEAQLG